MEKHKVNVGVHELQTIYLVIFRLVKSKDSICKYIGVFWLRKNSFRCVTGRIVQQ